MKETRSENILINPAFEDVKAESEGPAGYGRILRGKFGRVARIGDPEALRNILRQAAAYLLILMFLVQSSATVMASDRAYINSRAGAETVAAEAGPGYFQQAMGWLFGNEQPAANETPDPPPPPTISEAAISRHRPSLNGGTIDGSLRVFSGESFAINSQFHLNGDLYAVGTPNITVNSGASHGGVVNDGGSATPSGYGITLNSGVVLPGKIHTRANPTALPSDIPTSVPNPSGTRTVNINSPSDVNSIGNWATLRSLNVNPANLVINVPPGNYDTFSLNGPNIRLVFSAGTYNFSGTVNLNSGSNVQANGAVTINIGQHLNLNNGIFGVGSGTSPADVKLNIIGSSVGVNNNSQIWAMVRAANATVNLNAAIIRGHVIANYLNINSGQIVGDANPADTTQPALAITSPANNSTTTSATVNVTGTASDAGSGIAGITVNNVAAAYNAGNGTWSFANLALAMGSNTITVKATDGAGNITTQTVTVTRQPPPDVTVPSVAITSPANNTTVPDAAITVSGTASDTGLGATGINRVMVNGVQTAYNSAAGTWTISGVQLNEGANTITATAYDNATPSNSSQASITVTRFTPDTAPPAVAITSPANNSTVPDAAVTVSGTVADTGLNASGVNRVMVNGVQAAYNSAAGTWTISGVQLNEGANTITATAYDNAPTPNSSQTSISLTRTTPDTTPPTVAITSPADNTTVPDATVTISGTVADTGLNASGVNRVMVNGVQAFYDSGTGMWAISGVALNEGANTITAVAYDNAPTPNSSQVSITVTRFTPDTAPPTVAITSPADNSTVPDATVTVSGTVADTGLNASGVHRVMVNGVQASYDSGTGTWTISGVQLNEGANTITAIAYDNATPSNSSQVSITITRTTPDTQAPAISITSPADGSETYDAAITISGTATDTGLNAAGVASVTVNGQNAAYDVNTGQWTISGIALVIGDNTITATVTDAANPANQAQATIHITRKEIPAPTISITSPGDNSTTTAESIAVAGSASAFDTGGNQIVEVTVNGTIAVYDAASGTWFLTSLSLSVGPNVITATATDTGGRQTSAQITVTRAPANDPPVVNAGTDQTVTLPAAVNLNGSATDDGQPAPAGLSPVWSKISGPGTVVFASPNSLQTSAEFSAEGTYVLRLSVSDSALTGMDEVTVTVSAEPVGCPAGTFVDYFNDNQLDTTRWSIANPASPNVVSEQNQHLTITLAPNAAVYNSILTNQAYDFTNKTLSVDVIDPASQTGWVSTFMFLEVDSGNFYHISAGAGYSVFEVIYGNASTQRLVKEYNYQPHWRLRHDSAAGQVVFETSADALNWNEQHRVTPTVPLGALKVRLGTGAYGTGNSSPGQAVFDNLRLLSTLPSCAPSVSITQPAENGTFATGETIPVEASASDSDGTISKVEFFAGGVKIGEANAGPFVFNWTNAASGVHVLTAKATDNSGATAVSMPVNITVNAPVGVCYASDDFNDNLVDQSKWLAPAAGTQVYERDQRLEIVPFQEPYRGPDGAIKYNGYVTAASCDYTGILTSVEVVQATAPEYGAETDFRWTVNIPNDSSLNLIGFSRGGPTLAFYSYASGARSLTFVDYDPVAHRFWRIRHLRSTDEILWETSPNDANWTVQRRIARPFALNSTQATMQAGTYTFIANPGAAIFDNFVVSQVSEPNQAPVVSAGADQNIPAGTAANLSGSATHDNLPIGSTVAFTWSKVSGPGDVVFGDAAAAITTATFSAPGQYVLRLSASDGELSGTDDVIINSLPEPICYASDNFDDNTIDLAKWLAPFPDAQVYERNQYLEILPFPQPYLRPNGTPFYNGYYAAAQCDFTGVSSSVEIVQATPLEYNLETDFRWTPDSLDHQNINTIGTAAGGGNLVFYSDLNGLRTKTIINFEPAVHRFWRIRHIPATDEIVWETSPDNVNWTEGRRSARQFSLASIRVGLDAGTYLPFPNPTQAVYDNFVISRETAVNEPPVADYSVPSIGGPVGLTVTTSSGNGAASLLDESTFTNWSGDNNNAQFVKFELIGGEQLIQGFKFHQSNFPSSYMLKDFIVQVSTTTSDDSAFSTVLTGTVLQANNSQLQGVDLPGAVHAKYVKLIPVNNHGGAPQITLATFQVIGAGRADSLVSLPGSINAARRASPSLLKNGAAISRSTSYGSNPIELINGGAWKTNSKTNEFVVIKLADDKSHLLRGIRMGGNYADYTNYWVRDFEIWVSNTVDEDAAFTKVLDGVKTSWETEDFVFPGGEVQAKYIKYVPKSNQGSATFIGTFAIEALAVDGAGIHSFSSDYEHNRVERAFDGNPQNGWYCAPGRLTDQWVKLRLEGTQPQKIYGVRIGGSNSIFGAFGPRDFQVRVSTTTGDDSAFTVAHSGTLTTSSAMQEIRFAQPVDAKYVQFYWINGHSTSWLSVYELEVLPLPTDGAIFTNISSQATPTVPAARILDLEQGPNYGQWESVSGQNTDQSLTLRLYNGEQFDIRHVALRPGFVYPQTSMGPREFDIQVSTTDDAEGSFTTVFSGTAQPVDLMQHFYFPTVSARYVRLFIRNNYGNAHIMLNTFFVFAENTGATEARFFDRSADTDGSIVSYDWDFGDGSTGSGRNPVHTYAAEGVYNVALTVTDSSGATNTTVKPYHALPTLKADFAYSPATPVESDWHPNTVYFVDRSSSRLNNAGGQAMLNTADADYPFIPQSNSPSVLYRDNGNFASTIKVGSDYVLNYRATKNVAVQNLPPGVDITDGKTVYWGENWTNPIISLGDPGPADRASLSGVWNFGDGTSSTCTNCTAASAQGTHSYTLPGEYTAVLTITDKDGGSGSDSANYHVIKHPTAVSFNQPQRSGDQLTLSGTLRDTYANLPLGGKPVQIVLNGFAVSLTTDANGAFQTTFSLDSSAQIGQIISLFAEDDLYQGSSNIYSLTPVRDNPPSGTPSNGGTDFWLAFPANYVDGSTSGALLITSETDTSGTVTAPACGVNQAFQVTARTVTQISIPLSCQILNSNVVENLGIHVTAQAPVVVYGLNQRVFTTDAFLALPVPNLGREYYALAYGNQSSFVPSSQFGIVATENNTVVTITPTVTTGARQQGVPYQVNLNQGQTYLLRNTEIGDEKDLTGSSIAADKPVAVFGGHQAATLPAPTVCCADHLIEQMPPVNTWGKRFLLIPSATRTKGDFFRVVAAYDNTVVYLNGARAATINKGQFFEKLVSAASEVITTEPAMVGQYSTSAGFDTATYGGDPFMAIVPPYSQFLNHYTISTPNRFNNYVNLAVPTSIVGQVVLDGTAIAASQFIAIGSSGFSSAQVPISVGTHNLDAPAPFGVLSYGYSTDEGYGYPGGMSLIPTVRSTSLTLNPETAAFGTSSEGCVTASLKDENNSPLGGRAVSYGVSGANPTNGSGVTDASGQSQFCYIGTNAGSDTITATFESTNATATFIWSAVNQPPAVNAGSDQSITLPAVANLSGSATDDGYPTNTLTYAWSKVSGPGDVTFGAANALATTAAFSFAGAYVLRLTVSDGEFTVSDDVTITVEAGNVNQLPTANAGPDQAATLDANLLRNAGAESEPVGGELPYWTEAEGTTWARVDESAGGPPARLGRYTFNAGAEARAELRQDVDLRAFSQGINDGTLQFTWKAYIRSLPEAASDGGTVIVEYRDASNQNVIATLNSGEITTSGTWHETEDTRVPPAGTGYMRIRLIAQRHTGATNDVFFDGLSLRAEGPIAAVLLDGTTTDDGLPAGSVLQSTWTSVSGPGVVSFADPSAADTPAAFTVAGTYVLRLTATDGLLSAADDVTVTVNPANAAPVAGAGADQTITLPDSAQLGGTVTDDGEPQGGVITSRWTKVSGPGTVTFDNASAPNTAVSFGAAGTYVLRLLAEDGELEASDEVTITVNAPNNPVNQPPTVEAGNNQTIQLPVNSVTLNGTVTDDGLPNNNLTITWTRTSGPGNVSFTNPNSAQTTATFDTAGSYLLRLTASDGQYTSFDEVAIIVNAAGPQNQPPTVTISPDQTITLSQQAILEALTLNDDGLPVGAIYTYQWSKVSGPGTVTFTHPTETATYASFSEVGVYVVRLSASDSELTGSDEATVTVTEDQPAPAVEILTPDDGISITEPTAITGTVTAGNWRLEYSLTDTDNLNNRSWTTAASGTGAASGTLGTLDTTLMLNGTYDVRLITDNNGQLSSDIISVTVEGALKVGHFTVSFEDMSVPVAGIPIQIVRTYDSRDKRKGDFGYGWTLGIKNMHLEKNAVLGLKWYQTRSATFIPTYCVEATRPHIVSVTMPSGNVEKFEAGLADNCQNAAPITNGNLVFTPLGGARGKLEVTGSNEVAVAGSVPGPVDLIGFDTSGIYDRTSYKYTAKDGTEFIIDQLGGLQSVRDTNNNTLTISSSGITHSSGTSITFTRDASGRITHVTDPAGKSNVYTYDAAGDLVSFKDRENNTTSFTYEPTIPHHLRSIVDPLGRTGIRNEYDASGRLVKHIDGTGEEIVYTHDLTARAETVRDRLGYETRIEYDARGNVLKRRDPLNNETTFAYDANDNLLTETNALGKTTTYTYDTRDNRISMTDPLGNRAEFTYNLQGRVLTVRDARNNTTTSTYDTAGNLLTMTDALGNVTSNVYNAFSGKLVLSRNALNDPTAFTYFGNYMTKQTDAQGNETTFGYDANGNRNSTTVKRTNALGQIESITTSSEFDNLNRLVKTTLPDGTFTRVEYNEIGKQKATIDQAGRRTEYEYDALGRLIKAIDPDGKFTESTYDEEGRRLTSKDKAGRTTGYEYDALGRLTKTIYPDGTFTQTIYNAVGQVVSSTDAAGNTTAFVYDDAGRRIQIKNALQQVTEFTYDANGNSLTVKDALDHTTTSVYDEANRREKTIFADGTYIQTTFDALGRSTAERDQAGKISQYFYDTLGRKTRVRDALNQDTRYEYNEVGQQIKQIDALNRETRYEFDKLGRTTKRILPMGQVETYTYGTGGNLESRTDFNGKTTTFAYDDMRRLLSKTPDASLGQPAVSYTYNDLGQRTTMTDVSGTTNYAYDNRNRLASKQTPFGTLSYTYAETGNIETVRSSNPNGVSVDYDYDVLNRLKTVKDNRLSGIQDTTYTYDAIGNLQSYTYPNQVTTNYTYNSLNRLTNMTVANTSGGLAAYQYTLGAAGNRTQVVENTGRTVDYVYDDLYRLTQETVAGSVISGSINYGHDAVGNRLNRTSSVSPISNQASTFDANDRLESDIYDANGNTKVSNGRSYNYDFENHVTSTSDGVTIVYDGDGNRVSKTAAGVTTNYLVDTNNLTGYAQVVEEIQAGSVVKTYTYGHDLISQRAVGGNVSFYGYDGHGSVRNLTDSSAQITDTYTYDAFGNLIESTGTTANSYLYAGEQFDADLGFYYNRARYLNVATGRFISFDPYQEGGSDPKLLHKYLYGSSDPVNRIDPSGMIDFSIAGFTISITLHNVLSAMSIIGTVVSYLFLTDRVVAPGNDPIENEYYRTQADYRDAQINLAILIFTLFQVSAGARAAAGPGSGTIGAGKGRIAPYNPSAGQRNCAACVSAVIKTRMTKVFTTADDIEAIKSVPNLPNARATADYIEETAGVELIDSSMQTGVGHYVLVRNPTSSEPLGHVVYGRVAPNGKRYILDPQSGLPYFINVGQEMSQEVKALLGNNPIVLKVVE